MRIVSRTSQRYKSFELVFKMMGQYGLLAIVTFSLVAGVTRALPPQKIYGGQRATPGEFPYQVSLRIDGKHFCGGTIIDNRHILTAAHCVVGVVTSPYKNILVVTGSTKRQAGQTHVVKTVLYHPRYNKASAASPNDIALVVLAADIKFNDSQNKLALPTSATNSGVTATVTGWGYDRANTAIMPDDLMKVRVKTLTSAECQKHLGQSANLHVQQICTQGPPGRGFCQGDSGGPLAYNDQLIGVVSFNIPCAKGYPDVYSSVYHYVDWIRKAMTM